MGEPHEHEVMEVLELVRKLDMKGIWSGITEEEEIDGGVGGVPRPELGKKGMGRIGWRGKAAGSSGEPTEVPVKLLGASL